MSLLHAASRSATLALLVLAFTPAWAADVTVGDIVVHQPWSRATPGRAQVGGGYLTIENKGTAPDRLTGGTFAASTGFELHSMTMDGGIMRMRPTGPLEIPPGKTVVLDPSGLHIMFTGLKRGLKKARPCPVPSRFSTLAPRRWILRSRASRPRLRSEPRSRLPRATPCPA